jgi:hypothetical protein
LTDIFSHGFVAPGVFVEQTSTPTSGIVGVAPTVVAVVGPSIGYRTITDTIVLHGTTVVALSQTGVVQASIVVKGADGTVYSPTVDYDVATVANTDPGMVGTTIARDSSGSTITDGQTVYATYNYANDDFFIPHLFSNLADFQTFYGPAIDPSSNRIVSPLSLAASEVFQNGASQVVGVSTNDAPPVLPASPTTTRAALNAAYAALSTNIVVNVVVPVTAGIATGDVNNVAGDLITWLDAQALAGIYRTALLSYDAATVAGAGADPGTIASATNEERIDLVYPFSMNYFNGFNNTTIVVGGSYLAAGCAGVLAALPVNTPLTKKVIRGFTSIPASVLAGMTTQQKNTWSSQGVVVVEANRQGLLVVRYGTTTEVSSIYTREISLVRERDALVTLVADSLDAAGFVGQPITSDVPNNIRGVISGVLNTAVTIGMIQGFSTPLVRQTSIDPSIIQVTFSYSPTYALNYIIVTFSVNVATGDTLLAA